MVQDSDAPTPRPVLRFAPSPNGDLHLGHAYSALLNGDLARNTGGTLLLRLEDIDRERCREAYAVSIGDDLAWLGLTWAGVPRRQSEHLGVYREALERLEARQLVYPCFCTRGMILAAAHAAPTAPARAVDPDGTPLYPGTCRRLPGDERARRLARGWPATRRIDMARALAEAPKDLAWDEYGEGTLAERVAAEPDLWGDAIVGRKDITTSYHLSVVIDDALQGVTDVVRGRDLYHATALHRLLQSLLDLPSPRYHHHRLILDSQGQKLSKSRAAPSLRALRRDGVTPSEVRRVVGLA